MEISKSTPYVRYRENISSTLHKGTIHIESEYLDRERKTTIESIEGQTWQNMVNGENKEEDILPRLGLKIEGNEDILDTKEQHMPIDTIIGDIEPVANEDGTYTYEISTMEGGYAKTLNGENNFLLTSDGLDGSMYIKYNAQGEEVNGNIVMNNQQSSYTIENSNNGEIKSAILKGSTKYRDIDTGEVLDAFEDGRNLELVSVKMPVLTTYTNLFTGFINRGYINADGNAAALGNNQNMLSDFIEVKFNSIAFRRFKKDGTPVNSFGEFAFYDKNKNFISRRMSMDKVDESITLPNNTRYIRIWSKPVDKDDGGWDELAMLIYSNEAPSQIKSYLDNKTNILTVNEDVTLRSNGDVYDELNLLTGRLTQRIDENNEVLAQEVVKTVDLTVTDQDDKIIQSLHTHPSTTHINLSSDGLIPNAEMNYTMYGNIGETTGEKITDGTDSKLIEGKVYGDTLQNALPSPSLKNSMSYTSMQKLNNGYDNINVVDGDVKGATIYGDTLVNYATKDYWKGQSVSLTKEGGVFNATGSWGWFGFSIPTVIGEKYFVCIKSFDTDNSPKVLYAKENDITGNAIAEINVTNNGKYMIFTATTTTTFIGARTTINNYTHVIDSPIITKYQEGMENWDIPFFENTGSIQYPSLTTCGVNVFFEDNTMEYGAWSSEGNPVSTTSEIRCKNKYTPFPKGLKNGDVVRIVLSDTTINSDTNMHIYDESKTRVITLGFSSSPYIEGTNFVNGVSTITIHDASKCKYFSFRAISTNTECKFAIMVNTSASYEPHKSNTLTLNEPIELRRIGDVKDELDCLTGEVTQRIGEVVLDGSENWGMSNPDDVSICYTSSDFIGLFADVNGSSFIFDTIPFSNDNYHAGSKEGWFVDANKKLWIRMNDDRIGGRGVNNFKTWLSQNPITVLYQASTPTTLTVSTSIVDQDGATQPKLQSYANGYINVQSQGLLPSVNYEVSTNNSYYLDIIKTNTQYTSKGSSDCNATIDGNTIPLSANGTFTTPSTITDNLMVLDAQVDDLMFIEGDLTGRDLPYFEGIESVENPLVTVCNKNLLNPELLMVGSNFNGTDKNDNYRHSIFIPIEPNTKYCFRCMDFIYWYDSAKKQIGGSQQGWGAEYRIYTSPSNAKYARVTINHNNFPGTYKYTPSWFLCSIIKSNVNIYESYCGTDLKTIPQIALHKIGDVKDELDLVNECVIRKTKCMVFDGSDDENWRFGEPTNSYGMTYFNYEYIDNNMVGNNVPVLCDKFNYTHGTIHSREKECIGIVANSIRLVIKADRLSSVDIVGFKRWLSENPVTVIYQLETPITESVRIVPQNRKQSTTSLTLQSPLQKVGNVADQLRWNPYKGHYVRYNYIQDGVANSTYTFEDLKDMNERKFVNLYNQRTYIDTDHTVQVISHGISRYCLAEQGKQYQVRWDWVELPSVDTIKVDLCGNVKEIPSSDNSAIIDVERFTHQFVQIQGLGLTGKITNLMVIETIDGEIPDIDFFSGIQCIGNTVNIDGNTKVQIDMEQTNGNLLDIIPTLYNNGNNLQFKNIPVKHNCQYRISNELDSRGLDNLSVHFLKEVDGSSQSNITIYGSGVFDIPFGCKYITIYRQTSDKGHANIHHKIDLHYADMAKDGIRPRYYDKESIILPMKLCRVGNIYDNLYYDDLRGHYRIQQSIGHKYFTGGTTEVWTMETTNGYRTIKFTCTNANIDQMAYGETICNSFKHLPTINDDMEGFIIYNGNFVIRVDKDRISSANIVAFKEYLTSNQIHLFYQLKTPQMINLTEYPNRIELNTYRDEIFTFFKGMNPTKFTLSVPMDKTYRYEIAEEGQGLANRVTVNNETISAENVVAVKEIRGQGIANIIEDVNNVVITPRPNHEGRTTSHTLNNTKPAIIFVHGFEPSGDTAIGTYNVTNKAYQLKVMSSNGDNSLSDYYVLNVPYKLETYADGTKDMVYYDEAYKQWMFKGSSVKEYTVASNGTLSETIEIFRGLIPRSGLIAEFKLMFTSGTTAARMYYSLDGITYGYTQLRGMSDGNYLYVGIFNTGGTKIDIAYKTDPNAEYTNLVPLSAQVPECFMVNQITNCTFCELTLDKQYIYSEMNAPIELDTYEGSTKVFMDGNATDTNIIIRNEGTSKIVNTYTDTDYTVYWKYVDGLGNLRVTLGGTTVEVDGKQEYATLKTQLNAPQELLYVGGYNLSIKDLMVVKGAKIDDLSYFEGSRQVGTLVLDEEGNKSYKITLVQGGSVLEQRDENAITFKDDNKHNVVVHKIVGVCPTKVD